MSQAENRSRKSTRFALMCNGYVLKRWQKEALDLLLREKGLELCLVIRNGQEYSAGNKTGHLFYRMLRRFLLKVPYAKNINCRQFPGNFNEITCITEKKGVSEYFKPEDIAAIRACQPDFILRFGFGIIRGEILEAAPYGVWSFHHSDPALIRGGPFGLWEIIKGYPRSGAVFQKLNHDLDAGTILQSGQLKTIDHSLSANKNQLLKETLHWPLKTFREMQTGKFPEKKDEKQPQGPVYKKPGNATVILLLFKLFINKCRFRYKKLFKAEKWNIGICHSSPEELLRGRELEPHWLEEEKKSRYKADPFGFISKGKLHIVAEAFDYKTRKADIEIMTGRESAFTPVISEHFHLAYPFIHVENEKIYCIPESADNNQVSLYEYQSEKGAFVKKATLLNDFPAVDASLLKYNNEYWIFCTKKGHTNTHLYLFHSKKIAGPFLPHASNPVKCDISSSRPAGNFFTCNGKLIRPAQDSSTTYGGKIKLMEITELNKTAFSERCITEVVPDPEGRYPDGLHTLSLAGDQIIIDGKRETFIFQNLLYQIQNKLNLN